MCEDETAERTELAVGCTPGCTAFRALRCQGTNSMIWMQDPRAELSKPRLRRFYPFDCFSAPPTTLWPLALRVTGYVRHVVLARSRRAAFDM